ncbi:DUF2155 domain-containing protein [Paragemmobacter straminiformis]|uniref:DUF2155 domain-containing protein n=1 Tax=Paragemmobacter straminiformis TaxID=2045119 RepID=A0A842I6Z3_9RHOB|nr:DUF2155 domain-containing protein [Gemmobacter straminiformis]MBC2835173.1 DUF2155 domain-containing protein [Gemmobacter straminiformis]
MKRLVAALVLLPQLAAAQDFADADAGVLRWLDKLTGETADIELTLGQEAESGRLTIRLDSCRYPADNPASDAEAHLTILEKDVAKPVFDGWMIASSPALSALDHPRYDVWVLRCVTPELPPPVDPAADQPAEDPATSEGDGQ